MKNRKTALAIIGIVALILVTIGITYAYWLVTRTQTNTNVITTGCLNITLNGEANDITLTNQFPLSDEEGKELTPYEFTVTNNCNTAVDYYVNLESIGTESNAIIPEAIKAMLNETDPKTLYEYVGAAPTISGAYGAYILGYGTLAAASDTSTDDSITYKLRLWIDADAPISEMKKTYTGKISVSVGQGISAQGSTLTSMILADAETNNYLYTTTPDFSKMTSAGEYGIYSAEDDFGTSYYFRGDVKNNYVKLGKMTTEEYWGPEQGTEYGDFSSEYESLEACEAGAGNDYPSLIDCVKYGGEILPLYWRIMRINGDGSIRLVYDGTSAVANDVPHTANIKETAFHTSSDDAIYPGYTHDLNETDKTQVDSAIKYEVEDWYANNLESDYGKYIADGIFCNDREVTETFGTTPVYGAYTRLLTNKSPKLTCTRDEDKYTVSSSIGNGYLSKPIGLMTADEIAMAGSMFTGASNQTFYLYTTDETVWTMSPYFIGGVASITILDMEGSLRSNASDNLGYLRPVINIKANVLFEGTGISTDPYEIAM